MIKVKDDKKGMHLVNFLEQLDFVEIEKDRSSKFDKTKSDLFRSAGTWRDRDIDATKLRTEAWKIEG